MKDFVALGTGLGLACAGTGVGLIRWAWRRPRSRAATIAGWVSLAAAIPAWALTAAWDKATALALLAPSFVAFAIVASGVEVRRARSGRPPRNVATELPDHSGEAVWRGLVRTVCGGPLSGAAALVIGAAWALKAPGSGADRMAGALLLAPGLWAAGLIWSTTDTRLLRVGGGLGLLGLAGLLAATL